jgi:hypothetical protein
MLARVHPKEVDGQLGNPHAVGETSLYPFGRIPQTDKTREFYFSERAGGGGPARPAVMREGWRGWYGEPNCASVSAELGGRV